MHYTDWDEEATAKNVKGLLKGYSRQKFELLHLRLDTSLSAIDYDGMPNSTTNKNGTEDALINQISELEEQRAQLQHDVITIEKTIEVMGEPTQRAQQLAKLLEYRYIERWSVNKCCQQLATVFGTDFISDSKFHRDEREALLLFVLIYPNRNDLIVKAST